MSPAELEDLFAVPPPCHVPVVPVSHRIVALLDRDPTREWRIDELARTMGLSDKGAAVRLAALARLGFILRVGHGRYRGLRPP